MREGLCGWNCRYFFIPDPGTMENNLKNIASKKTKRCMKIIKNSDFSREMSENAKNLLNLPKLLCKRLKPMKNLESQSKIYLLQAVYHKI